MELIVIGLVLLGAAIMVGVLWRQAQQDYEWFISEFDRITTCHAVEIENWQLRYHDLHGRHLAELSKYDEINRFIESEIMGWADPLVSFEVYHLSENEAFVLHSFTADVLLRVARTDKGFRVWRVAEFDSEWELLPLKKDVFPEAKASSTNE